MNEKKQRRSVLIGVLLLTGLFALGYIGINRIAFAGSAATAVLGVQDNSDEQDEVQSVNDTRVFSPIYNEYRLITETADANNGRETGGFNVDRLVPLQDHYLTRYEAEVIVAEILSERLGVVFNTSEFTFGLLDQTPGSSNSMWLTTTPDYDINGQIHDVSIDTVTGELLEFSSFDVSVDFFTTVSHNGVNFMIEERGHPIEGAEYTRYIRPYMLTQLEAATMAADLIYEEFGVTMEGLRMQMPLIISSTNEGFWNVWIMPSEYKYEGNGIYVSPANCFYVFINATTGEIENFQDLRGADECCIIESE